MFLSSECHNVRVGWIPMFSGKCSWRDVFINSPANKQIWKGEDSLDNIQFNPILCDGAEKWACVMIKIMMTSFLLKMAVAVTPLHSMLTSILSPLTVLLTTVVTPCLTCINVTMWHHYIQHTSYSYLSVEVHTRVCESSRKLKILVTVLRSVQNEKNEYTYLKW